MHCWGENFWKKNSTYVCRFEMPVYCICTRAQELSRWLVLRSKPGRRRTGSTTPSSTTPRAASHRSPFKCVVGEKCKLEEKGLTFSSRSPALRATISPSCYVDIPSTSPATAVKAWKVDIYKFNSSCTKSAANSVFSWGSLRAAGSGRRLFVFMGVVLPVVLLQRLDASGMMPPPQLSSETRLEEIWTYIGRLSRSRCGGALSVCECGNDEPEYDSMMENDSGKDLYIA